MRKSGTQESKDQIIVDEETENVLQLDDRMAVETSVDAVDAWSEEVEILLPFPYRIYDCDPTESIDSTWMELYVENDTFFIDNADFSIIEGMDDCSGYPTKTIQTERNTLVFFNIPTLKAGRVNNIEVEQKRVWPNEQIQIVFDNTSYQLRAEGEVLSSETVVFSNEIGPEKWQEVADYRLFSVLGMEKNCCFLTSRPFTTLSLNCSLSEILMETENWISFLVIHCIMKKNVSLYFSLLIPTKISG